LAWAGRRQVGGVGTYMFYVRAAIEADTGVKYTLKHVETAMKAEGMLNEG
jgi:hypothetical protein